MARAAAEAASELPYFHQAKLPPDQASERARGRKLNCRLTTRCAINDDSNVGPARARRAAAAEMRKNESPAARPAAVSCGKGGIVRSAAERITARRRTVTIRDTSDGCLAAGHANIRLGGRRAGERVGDDATSRNRYLRTAPGGRAGKSGENAFPQIILAGCPSAALRPPSVPSLSFDSVCRPRSFSEPEPTSVAFGILAIPYQAISAGKGDGGGTGRGPADGRLSLRRTPTTHSDSQSLRRVSPFPSSCLPTRPPSLPPFLRPSVRRRHLRFSLFTSE